MSRKTKKRSPVQKKKSAKGKNSPGTPQSEVVQETLKSRKDVPGESEILVEKSKAKGDKQDVNLKEASFQKITNEDKKEIGVLDRSGIVEAKSTNDKGGDKEMASQREALEQFPSWHPRWKELHVELYEDIQKVDKLYPEPIFDQSSPMANDIQKAVARAFGALNCELTEPFIDFFTSIQQLDLSQPISSEYIQQWEEFFSIPLFYLRQLITSFAACFMCHRTISNRTGMCKMFKTDFKTKHLLHVAYFKPRESLNSPDGSQVMDFAKEINKLFDAVFHSFNKDEKLSVLNSMNHGNAFVLFALNAAGTQKFLIGVVLFSADEDGIWINWIAVGNEIFDRNRFGKKATQVSF